MTFVWIRNTVRIYLSSVAGRFVWIRATAGEHTGLLGWPADLSLSPKLQTLYCLSTLIQEYEHASSPTSFLFMVGCQNIHTYFFSVICWSYLRTEISLTLSTGNILHSSPSTFILLFPVKPHCWCYFATSLNLLSSSTAFRHRLSQYITLCKKRYIIFVARIVWSLLFLV